MYEQNLISLFVTRTKGEGVNLCYVNRNNISTIEFDEDYIVITLVNNDVLYAYYDILMTIKPLGLENEIDMLSVSKGFQKENSYFNMEDFKNGEVNFSKSLEEKKAFDLKNEKEINDFMIFDNSDYTPF